MTKPPKLPVGVTAVNGSVVFKRDPGLRIVPGILLILLILVAALAAESAHPLDKFATFLLLYLPMSLLLLRVIRQNSGPDIELAADRLKAGSEVVRFSDIRKVAFRPTYRIGAFRFFDRQGMPLTKSAIRGPGVGGMAFLALLQAVLPGGAVIVRQPEAERPKRPLLQCVAGIFALVAGCFLCVPAFAAIPAVGSGGDLSSLSSSHAAPLSILGIELALFGLIYIYDVVIWPIRKRATHSETQVWPKEKLIFFDLYYPFVCNRHLPSRVVFGYDAQPTARKIRQQRLGTTIPSLIIGVLMADGLIQMLTTSSPPLKANGAFILSIMFGLFFVALISLAALEVRTSNRLLKSVGSRLIFDRDHVRVASGSEVEEVISLQYMGKRESYCVRATTDKAKHLFSVRLLNEIREE